MRRRRRSMRRHYRRVYRRSRRRAFAKRVKSIVAAGSEQKVTTALLLDNYPSVGTAWRELEFQDLAEGHSSMQRIGDRFRIKSITFRGTLMGAQTAGIAEDVYNQFRIVIAIWRQDAGATPLATLNANLDDPLNPREAAAFDGIDPPLLKNKMVSKLFDRKYMLITRGLSRYDANQYIPAVRKVYFKKVWPGLGYEIKYGDTGLGYPDKRLIISMVSDSAAVPHPGFIDGWVMMKFVDI